MAYDEELAAISIDKNLKKSMGTNSLVITDSTEQLRSLFQTEVKWAVKRTQREEMKTRSENLIEDAIFDVFAKSYCTATKRRKKHFLVCR